MRYRPLGHTGVEVSPLCLGAMMFGAWGNPDHDESIRIIHRALDAGHQLRRHRRRVLGRRVRGDRRQGARGGRRDDVVLATKFHGPMGDDRNRRGNSRRWIMREVEDSLRRLRHRLDRPLPGAPARAGHRHRRDAGRAHRPRARRARSATSAARPSRPTRSSRPSGWPSGAGCERFVERAAAVLDARARHRGRRAAGVPQRYGMGVIPWSPLAGGWLSGRYRTGTGAEPTQPRPSASRRASTCRSRPTRRKLEAADALAELAEDAGLSLIHLALAFVINHPAVTAADHRPAHDGAAREPARRGRRRPRRRRCSTGSTRSSPPGTNLNPADAGYTPPSIADPTQRRR